MYKTILVHVDSSPRAEQRIDLACRLALQHDAHLIGTAPAGITPYLGRIGKTEKIGR